MRHISRSHIQPIALQKIFTNKVIQQFNLNGKRSTLDLRVCQILFPRYADVRRECWPY